MSKLPAIRKPRPLKFCKPTVEQDICRNWCVWVLVKDRRRVVGYLYGPDRKTKAEAINAWNLQERPKK